MYACGDMNIQSGPILNANPKPLLQSCGGGRDYSPEPYGGKCVEGCPVWMRTCSMMHHNKLDFDV